MTKLLRIKTLILSLHEGNLYGRRIKYDMNTVIFFVASGKSDVLFLPLIKGNFVRFDFILGYSISFLILLFDNFHYRIMEERNYGA